MTKLFKKQMKTIAITIIAMIVIGVICERLTTNGLGSLFTIKTYKEAFTRTEFDIYLIKVFASAGELIALSWCYIAMKYNKEIDDIEKEEELFFKEVNEND